MRKFQARQGDIFFRKVAKLPDGLKPKADNILAYGEVTGHAHKIVSPSISEMESYVSETGDIYVRSSTPIEVGHDEHNIVTLPKNEWICITRQREYDPLAVEKERRVAD